MDSSPYASGVSDIWNYGMGLGVQPLDTKAVAASGLQAAWMLQQRFWPLRIVDMFPRHRGTYRLGLRGAGDDGMPYFLKGTDSAPSVPATELLSSGLALVIGLAVPTLCIAHKPDGFYPAPTDDWIKCLKT